MWQCLGAENIEFLGYADNLPQLYARARAFLFPTEEDFGLTPVEALCTGTPVIYYAKGGATESVTQGCGLGFDHQTEPSLQGAIDRFTETENSFDREALRARGAQFDKAHFIRIMQEIVAQK